MRETSSGNNHIGRPLPRSRYTIVDRNLNSLRVPRVTMSLESIFLLTLCLLNFVKSKDDHPPFYAINMDEDTDIFTIFEQDSCDPTLYQSRKDENTYLFPDPENSNQWLIRNKIVENFREEDGCKLVDYGEELRTLNYINGILSQKSRDYLEILRLDLCKKYPFSKTLSEFDFEAKAADENELLSLFGENGELNQDNENKDVFFLQYSINNNYYEVYSSEDIVFLTHKSEDETNFIVFKTDCISSGSPFSFHDDEIEDISEDNADVDSLTPLKDGSQPVNLYLLIGASLAIIFLTLVVVSVGCCMKKKIWCFQKANDSKLNGEVKVHQNDLYGNLSNLEEWQERYDTNITDTNTYYEDYYSGDQNVQNEGDQDKAETKESRKDENDTV